jgi:hypothetical protein
MEQIYCLTFGFDSLQVNKPCFSAKNQCKSLNQKPLQKCDLVVLGTSLFCPPHNSSSPCCHGFDCVNMSNSANPYAVFRQRPKVLQQRLKTMHRQSGIPLPTLGPWPPHLSAPSPPTRVCDRQITLPRISLACAIPRNLLVKLVPPQV